MAPHRSELTLEQKELIIQLSNEGFLSHKIQDPIGINSSTIQKFLKRVRKRRNIENVPRSGRKRKTTA